MATQPNLIETISRWDPNTLPAVARWVLALFLFLLAFLTRYFLEGILPPGFPYLTFFPAILIAAYFLGAAPGIAVGIAGGLAAWYFFIPPFNSFSLSGATVLALVFYLFVMTTEVALVALAQHALRALTAERQVTQRLAEQRALMFHELQHRVSNNLATVSGLMKLQRRLVSDEAAGIALDNSVRRIDLVARIMRNLHSFWPTRSATPWKAPGHPAGLPLR
jgi:two-component system, sensor histidine kinase PdtaS